MVHRPRTRLGVRGLLAVCGAAAAVGVTATSATGGQPPTRTIVLHRPVPEPGTYRITVELSTRSAARDAVVLRVGRRSRRVTLDRRRRIRVTLRVRVRGHRVTVRVTMRRGSTVSLAIRRVAAVIPKATPTPRPPPGGSTPTTGTGPSTTPPPGGSSGELPSGQAMPLGDIPGWRQTYAEDFSGSSVPSSWDVYKGQPGGDPAGWWDPSHVSVSGGELQILSSRDPAHCPSGCHALDDLVSGGVQLSGHSQTYGKYEIRMRADNAKGLGLTVLLWPVSNQGPPETDMIADVGFSPRVGTGVGVVFGANDTDLVAKNTTADLSQWHTWGAEWTPGKVAFTLDGNVWATETNPNVSSVPMNLAIQMQAYPCSGPGSFGVCADSTTPASSNFDVDWVTQYSPG
ncbi:MAG: glycoside hydrolase family 16 protein [Solirubrobacteraceae bacterium]